MILLWQYVINRFELQFSRRLWLAISAFTSRCITDLAA
jgi:hypothetical protein